MKKLVLFFIALVLSTQTFAQTFAQNAVLVNSIQVETEYSKSVYPMGHVATKGDTLHFDDRGSQSSDWHQKVNRLILNKKGGGILSLRVSTGRMVEISFKGVIPAGDFSYTLVLTKKARKSGLTAVTITRSATFEEALFEMDGVKWYSSLEGARCGSTETPLKEVSTFWATFRCPEEGCAAAGEITVTKTADGWKVKLPDGTVLDGHLDGNCLKTGFAHIQLCPSGGKKRQSRA